LSFVYSRECHDVPFTVERLLRDLSMSANTSKTRLLPEGPKLDEDVRREIWRGAIPTVFSLTPNEITVPVAQAPHSYYALLPRGNYLPACTSGVHDHFAESAPALSEEMWFEHRGRALKWNYPVGVLFDFLCDDSCLPWQLTIHFQGYPHDKLLRCGSEDVVKNHFYNVLKAANYMKHGDGSKVNSLSVQEFNALWDGLRQGEFDEYSHPVYKIRAEPGHVKQLPVRVIIPTANSSSDTSFPYFSCLQHPFLAFVDQDGTQLRTLGHALHELLPALFPSQTERSDMTCVVQGLEPDLDTPLHWLTECASYPDNFLYLVIKPKKA